MNEIKVGTIVNANDTDMTVSVVLHEGVRCQWFEGTTLRECEFKLTDVTYVKN